MHIDSTRNGYGYQIRVNEGADQSYRMSIPGFIVREYYCPPTFRLRPSHKTANDILSMWPNHMLTSGCYRNWKVFSHALIK